MANKLPAGRIAQVSMFKGWAEIMMTIDVADRFYQFAATGFERDSHGLRAGNTHTRKFLRLDEAKKYGNDYWAKLKAKGYRTARA